MGLAFRLDTTFNPYTTQGLSNYFVNFPAQQIASKVTDGGDPLAGCSFFDQLQTDKTQPNGWEFRWCGKAGSTKQSCQGIFPTGEFCIRDITFVNGYYAIVGAYKATFLDLYGAGSHGLAWDGFLMMYRGFSDNFFVPFGADGTINPDPFAATGIGILPMRMPYDILPSTNSATTEAMDDVGLYTVDVWRGSPTISAVPQPGGGDPQEAFNIQLWLGGTQGVSDPVAQGMTYTNIDRIAFGMVGVFGTVTYPEVQGGALVRGSATEYVITLPQNIGVGPLASSLGSYDLQGTQVSATTFDTRANQTIKFAWRATANDTMYQGPAAGTCILWRTCDMDVQMSISGQERGGNGGFYNFQRYNDGWLPNGTNQCTGDTSGDDTQATTWNYYPRRFMDVQAYSAETTVIGGVSRTAFTPCMFAGDMWVGTDDPTAASPSAKVFPAGYAMCLEPLRVNIDDFCNPGGVCFLNPFMQGFTAQLSFKGAGTGAPQPTIVVGASVQACIKTSGGVANWNGLADSYFAFTTLPYEEIGADYDKSDNPSGRAPLRYFFCNAIKYADSSIGTGIFQYEESPLENELSVFGFAFNGQRLSSASDTLIPIEMPNKWTAKISQTRTFTVQEEESAKSLIDYPGGVFLNGEQVFNSRNGEAVGVRNNYPRLGVEPIDEETYDFTKNALAQQGAKTQEAQGCMGYKSTAIPADPSTNGEPIVVLFDSGGGWFRDSTFPVGSPNYANPPTYSNSLQNRGATFNSNILVDKNSTNRAALGCSWDNDRDQWIFLFGNYTGVAANQSSSLVSVTSTFTNTARFGSAYLDQTANFEKNQTSPTTFNNIIWNSFPMTNNLDGIVIFGQTNSGSTNMQNPGSIAYTSANLTAKTDRPQEVWARNSGTGTRALPAQGDCAEGTDPANIEYTPSSMNWFNLDGSTGREAFVWVDYILFDGADAVIATKLRERGMKVSIDAVEWFKRKIINSGDLNIKQEEIEMWMRQQQDEFSMMMRDAERQGRVRKKKKQVSAYGLSMLDSINTDFEDKEIQEFMQDYLPKSRPPTPEEEMIERQRKGGYSPQAKSYFDEVFEQ